LSFENWAKAHDFPHELVANDAERDAIVDDFTGSPAKGDS